MSEVVNGVISIIREDRKVFKIGDSWYSCFKPTMLGSAAVGDNVKFEMKKNGTWNNVVGSVQVVGAGETSLTQKTADSGALINSPAQRHTFYDKNLGYLVKTFPVAPLHPDRAIIRQNALTHATAVVLNTLEPETSSTSMTAAQIINIARVFESYAAGDIDREEAEAMAAEMVARA